MMNGDTMNHGLAGDCTFWQSDMAHGIQQHANTAEVFYKQRQTECCMPSTVWMAAT
jgi:hypothetical protein